MHLTSSGYGHGQRAGDGAQTSVVGHRYLLQGTRSNCYLLINSKIVATYQRLPLLTMLMFPASDLEPVVADYVDFLETFDRKSRTERRPMKEILPAGVRMTATF